MVEPTLPTPPAQAQRIGELLLRQGIVTPDQIEVALHEKARTGKMLGTVLVDLGFIKPTDLSAVLASRSGIGNFNATTTLVDPVAGRSLPRAVAERHRVALIATQGNDIWLAMVDPYDVVALDAVRRHVPADSALTPLIITAADLGDVHDFIYGYTLGLESILHELRALGEQGAGAEFSNAELARGFRHPIVRLVNMLMLDAVKQRASDVHFEPEEYFIRIRLRVDGVLQQVAALHKDFWSPLSHRLKIMAGMNIADKLQPQDGRFSIMLSGRAVDFRVATLPGVHGENISVRVLDQQNAMRPLAELGFAADTLAAITAMLKRPEGLIIVTGPTGSGKTTTLYAALGMLADVKRNIMTLEDPIEYQFPLIRQTQIREATGLTFAEGVRAILRQDPDIILIGEIRDAETAQMALRAAMTGHLVLTTLHTRDALGVLPRLHDLGLSPALLAGNLNGIVAQRLVRKAGGRGRVPIAETIVIDEQLDELVANGAGRAEWLQVLRARNFKSLRDHGLALVQAGIATRDNLAEAIDIGAA